LERLRVHPDTITSIDMYFLRAKCSYLTGELVVLSADAWGHERQMPALEIEMAIPGGRMPPSTAGETPAATWWVHKKMVCYP